ncbi:MAG: hypothetical protein ACFNTA_10190, partial [Campylobacter sp.]
MSFSTYTSLKFDFQAWQAMCLAYAPIERKIAKYLKTYANTHSESASNALKTQKRYEKARQSL